MTEEIKLIIEKNLPAQVGDVLKTRLEQAERDAERVKQLEEESRNQRVQISSYQNAINSYKSFDDRNSKLNERDLAITEKERNQKVFELELKLTEA